MNPRHRALRSFRQHLIGKLNKIRRMTLQEKPGNLSPLHQLVSALLAVIMGLSCKPVTSILRNDASSPGWVQGEVVPVSSPALPEPPPPFAVSLQNPEQEASRLVNALAGPDNLAAWLGLYHALGIPVIGENRLSLDGSDDPIGPPYWQVWYTASLDIPGRGILVSDAGRLFGLVFGMNPEDSQTMGETLLSDLRSALRSQDAAVHLLGAVARERILLSGSKLDILDSATTAQTASIDVPMLQLIFWVVLRGTLFNIQSQSAGHQGRIVPVNYLTHHNALQPQPFNCSEAWGDADTTYWVNWITNKVFGGVQLPGMAQGLPGLLERTMNYLGVNANTIAATGKAIGWANAIGSAISLLMQLASMDLVGIQNPDKLERTKERENGKTATITWRLMSDPEKLPDGNEARQCFISFISNVLGAGFTFPGEGRIPGAELTFKAGKNIPDRVLFGDYKQLRSWTNQNGEVNLLMIGAAQNKDIPQSAKADDEEYSVLVSAQPEESGLNTMVNIFFGGLTFGTVPGASGFIGSLIDIIKTMTFDMGEHVFPMIDWSQKIYRASGGSDMGMIGTICDLEKKFKLHALADTGVTYEFDFTPITDTAGSLQYSGSSEGCTESGTGTYTIELNEDGSMGTVNLTVSGSIVCPEVSSGYTDSDTFDLTADPNASCP